MWMALTLYLTEFVSSTIAVGSAKFFLPDQHSFAAIYNGASEVSILIANHDMHAMLDRSYYTPCTCMG